MRSILLRSIGTIAALTIGLLSSAIFNAAMAATVTLDMDTDPITEGWTLLSGGGSHSVSNGILTIDTNNFREFRVPTASWEDQFTGANTYSWETRMKVVSAQSDAVTIWSLNGGEIWRVFFLENEVRLNNQSYAISTTDDFHTYRLETLQSTANLYIDGLLVMEDVAPDSGQGSTFFFGDGNGSLSSETNWDYLSITINPLPIPAPAAMWLFGSALGLLGWMRRQAT